MNSSHICRAFLQYVLGYESSMDLIANSSMDSMGTKIIFYEKFKLYGQYYMNHHMAIYRAANAEIVFSVLAALTIKDERNYLVWLISSVCAEMNGQV